MPADASNATTDPGFFDGRLMVEIGDWDWNLHVRLSSPLTPPEARFQGGLNYTRGIELIGRIRAPHTHRGMQTRVWISPFGPEIAFGPRGLDDVGRLYWKRDDALGSGLRASLLLPESALAPALTCLSSVWKYLDIWAADDDGAEASVTAFSFCASIHPNLAEWAGPELERG